VRSGNRPDKEFRYLLHAPLLVRLLHKLNRKERPNKSLLFLCFYKNQHQYGIADKQLPEVLPSCFCFVTSQIGWLAVVIDKWNAHVMLTLEHDLDLYNLFFLQNGQQQVHYLDSVTGI
jgi:hypothetical protein